MATEVEVLGHKAKIEQVSSQVKEQPWQKEDQLVVWLRFDEAVGSVLSFAVLLPVKKYEREELLYNIRRRGEEQLKLLLERHEKEKREMQERKAHKIALDLMAEQAQSLIE